MFIADFLKGKLQAILNVSECDFSVFPSGNSKFGDYATNIAFVLAKNRSASPFALAEDLKKELETNKGFCKFVSAIEAKSGYINFVLHPAWVAHIASENIQAAIKQRKKKTIVVDYSSPNIGKTLAIAHIRSTIIGDALARIYMYMGWRVITDSHVGDWGMLAGKLIAAYRTYSKKSLAQLSLEDIQDLYVRFTNGEEDNPELTERAKQETVKLQRKDKENMKIWRALVKISIREFTDIYALLGTVPFQHQYGESHYRTLADSIVKDLVASGIAQKSQGALIVPLDQEKLPPALIQKTDEAFLYITSDLGTIAFRCKTWRPDAVLYVVANEQALHFEQLFAINRLHPLDAHALLVHVKFGMMLGFDGKKFSTRHGSFISLRDVISEARERAYTIAKKKNPTISEKQLRTIARVIGIGAIKYNDLSQNRNTDVLFDWDAMLSLSGNSAPYVQYTYARLSSICAKAKAKVKTKKTTWTQKDFALFDGAENVLLKKLIQFHDVVLQASQEYAPNYIANYVYEVATMVNAWYETHHVVHAGPVVQSVRLKLVAQAMTVIKMGLGLLGIGVLSRM